MNVASPPSRLASAHASATLRGRRYEKSGIPMAELSESRVQRASRDLGCGGPRDVVLRHLPVAVGAPQRRTDRAGENGRLVRYDFELGQVRLLVERVAQRREQPGVRRQAAAHEHRALELEGSQ